MDKIITIKSLLLIKFFPNSNNLKKDTKSFMKTTKRSKLKSKSFDKKVSKKLNSNHISTPFPKKLWNRKEIHSIIQFASNTIASLIQKEVRTDIKVLVKSPVREIQSKSIMKSTIITIRKIKNKNN